MLVKRKHYYAVIIFVAVALISTLVLNISSVAANTVEIKSAALKINNKTVTKKTYSLKKGKKATVKVSVTPIKAKKSIVFKSSNKKVATVSRKGVVTAKKAGIAKISVVVKGKNGKKKSTWLKIKVTAAATKASKKPTEKEEPKQTVDTTPTPDTEQTVDPTPSPDTEQVVKPAPTPDPITIQEYYIEYGSNKIYGKMYTPKKEGVYPAVIMCHGYNGVGADFVKECTYFAQNGYIAYAFDFCGGSGRSKSSGKSTDMTIFTEKDDLVAVFNHIKELSNVDSDNIFLHGGSQGGLVAALAAEELGDEVKGLMLYFPAFNIPYDWTNMHPDVDKIPEVIPWWGLNLGREFAVSIHGYKTFEHIGSYSKNVLILYGAKDAIVQRYYVDKAKEIYKNCELIVYPNEGHGFTPAGVDKAKEELLNFMKRQ